MNGINRGMGYEFWKEAAPHGHSRRFSARSGPLFARYASRTTVTNRCALLVTGSHVRNLAGYNVRSAHLDSANPNGSGAVFNPGLGRKSNDFRRRNGTVGCGRLAPVLISLARRRLTVSKHAGRSAQDSSSQGTWHRCRSDDRMFFPKTCSGVGRSSTLRLRTMRSIPNLCAGNSEVVWREQMRPAVCSPATCCREFWRFVPLAADRCGVSWCTERRHSSSARPSRRRFTPGRPDAIGIEHSWGAGIYLNKGFEFRVTQHFLFDRLGARNNYLGAADLGNNGPMGTLHDRGRA